MTIFSIEPVFPLFLESAQPLQNLFGLRQQLNHNLWPENRREYMKVKTC